MFRLISTALAAILIILIAAFSGQFRLFDGWSYDPLVRIAVTLRSSEPRVLVVEPGTTLKPDWSRLINEVKRLQPTMLVFDGKFPGLDKSSIQDLKKLIPVVVDLSPDLHTLGREIQLIVENTPFDDRDGVVRSLPLKHPTSGAEPLLVNVLKNLNQSVPEADSYLINFIQAAGRIPQINLERLLNGGLIPELVRHKVVYILDQNRAEPRWLSPMGDEPLSEGQFHAHALDTLLTARRIDVIGFSINALVTSIFGLFALLLLWRVPRKMEQLVLLAFLLIEIFLSWWLLSFFLLWLAWLQTALATILVYMIVVRAKRQQQDETLRTLANETAALIESQWFPDDFYSSDAHWDQVATLVSQTFSLNRSIFLERVENDHRIREVKAINCNIDDIYEMRRDFEREPYTSALRAKGPVTCSRNYFTNPKANELQFITPILYGGDVMGFWAFVIIDTDDLEQEPLLETIGFFSNGLGEMLYQRRQHRIQLMRSQNLLHRLMRLDTQDSSHIRLSKAVNQLNRKIFTMNAVYESLGVAAIIFDLFGRVIQVNHAMQDLLVTTDLNPYQIPLTDLVSQLTGQNIDRIRGYVRYLMINKRPITLAVRESHLRDDYLLNLRVVQSHDGFGSGNIAVPFELIGVLCELTDIRHQRREAQLKEQLINQIGSQYRNDLEAVKLASHLINDERSNHKLRRRVVGLMNQKTFSLVKNTERVQQLLEMNLGTGVIQRYPVNIVDSLKKVLEESKPLLEERRITLENSQPSFITLGFAEPTKLHDVFTHILHFLINDSVEGGTLHLTLWVADNWISFRGKSQGFGMPNERLRQHLKLETAGRQGKLDDDFRNLRTAIKQVKFWGGQLQIRSQVGEGTAIKLSLEVFNQ